MKTTATLLALAGLAAARDISLYGERLEQRLAKREVPQEHAHQDVLNVVNPLLQKNNPLGITDAVFALLGNKAAATGAPNVANLDCLQQIVADQAFTNAKADGDVDGMVNAILFRALERNTGAVGLASVLCNETATNPEIAAVSQHQDPASPEASGNKAIALAVAKSIASVGGDPTLAIGSGTFAPGTLGDPTAKGNTCDDANDSAGCINSQGLLVPDVTVDEINAAVAGVSAAAGASSAVATSAASAVASSAVASSAAAVETDASSACAPATLVTSTVYASAATSAAAAAVADTTSAAAAAATTAATATTTSADGTNVQTFTGSLGGAPPPVISSAANPDRPFSVDGSTFVNIGAALQRSCSVQHNACANAANSGQLAGGVGQCETQESACEAAASASKRMRKVKKVRRW